MEEWMPVEWIRKKDERSPRPIHIHATVSNDYPSTRYAVRDGGMCLGTDSEWDYEPMPSNRDDAFYEKYRFKSFEEAVKALEKNEAKR